MTPLTIEQAREAVIEAAEAWEAAGEKAIQGSGWVALVAAEQTLISAVRRLREAEENRSR